jgi:hypothetical protein
MRSFWDLLRPFSVESGAKRNMSYQAVQRTIICLGVFAGLPSVLVAQLQSVDEAIALSRKTGRPIFAMAGNKT